MPISYIGLLHDGKTAQRKGCLVEFNGDRLRIHGPNLDSEHSWSIKDVRLIDETWHEDEPFQLRCGLESDVRVELSDQSILPILQSKNAALKKDVRTVAPAFTAAIALAVVVASIWFSLPYMATAIAKLAPRSWEEKLGETVADTAISFFTFSNEVKACVGGDGTNAIFNLVAKIDENDGADYTYRLRVIDDDTVNAFAAPGGYIVVFRGIIEEFENGDEFAAVLAHEIAHVTNQHSLEGIIKAIGASAIASIVTGDVTGSAFGLGIEHSLSAQNSQTAEKEADLDGINFLNSANITSTGLGTFFSRLGEGEEDSNFNFLESHPSSGARAEYSQTLAKSGTPAFTATEWTAVQNICEQTEELESFEWPEWMLKIKNRLPKSEEV